MLVYNFFNPVIEASIYPSHSPLFLVLCASINYGSLNTEKYSIFEIKLTCRGIKIVCCIAAIPSEL